MHVRRVWKEPRAVFTSLINMKLDKTASNEKVACTIIKGGEATREKNSTMKKRVGDLCSNVSVRPNSPGRFRIIRLTIRSGIGARES